MEWTIGSIVMIHNRQLMHISFSRKVGHLDFFPAPSKIMPSVVNTAGIYIPPFKLARLKEEVTDPNSHDGQRVEWERSRKAIKGLVNKVSTSNLKNIVQDLFIEDLLRARGIFVRAVMHAQMASPVFSGMFSALVAVVNTKIPEIGDLLLRRLILQFRRAYTRSDEIILMSVCKFIAHLFNQRVVSEMVILQIVTIFLEKLSSDSVKVCCHMLFDCGDMLSQVSSKGMYFIFERLRQILQEGLIDKRVLYIIESLFEARRKKFVGYPSVLPELDLVEEDDQVTHEVDVIEGEIEGEESLNMFHALDPEAFIAESAKWRDLSNEILGITGDEHEEDEDEEEAEEEVHEVKEETGEPPKTQRIADMTEQDLLNLRKTIYLAIMSSANFEECVHKILSLRLRNGQEREVVIMLIDSAAMEKASNKFFHFQAERLCRLSRVYRQFFEDAFGFQYAAMHRHETNKIRNIAKLFSHLLVADAVSWTVLKAVQLTESETTSSTRIFIKILFQDLVENLGLNALVERVKDERFADALSGIFPSDSIDNMKFSINFFTAIGLGQLTVEQRHRLNDFTMQTEIKRSLSPERHVMNIAPLERSRSSERPHGKSERSGSYERPHGMSERARGYEKPPVESSRRARSYERAPAESTRDYDRPGAESTRNHDRPAAESARNHDRAADVSSKRPRSYERSPSRGDRRDNRRDYRRNDDRRDGDRRDDRRNDRSRNENYDRGGRYDRQDDRPRRERRRSRSTDSFGRRRRDMKSEDRSQ